MNSTAFPKVHKLHPLHIQQQPPQTRVVDPTPIATTNPPESATPSITNNEKHDQNMSLVPSHWNSFHDA